MLSNVKYLLFKKAILPQVYTLYIQRDGDNKMKALLIKFINRKKRFTVYDLI